MKKSVYTCQYKSHNYMAFSCNQEIDQADFSCTGSVQDHKNLRERIKLRICKQNQ